MVVEAWPAADYETLRSALVRSLTRRTHNVATAEDFADEAFARLVAKGQGGAAPLNAGAWLQRVASNLLVSASRRGVVAAAHARELSDGSRPIAGPEMVAVAAEQLAAVDAALGRLPPRMRYVLRLAAAGWPPRDIARHMGRSDTATRTLLCRARLRLRDELGERPY